MVRQHTRVEHRVVVLQREIAMARGNGACSRRSRRARGHRRNSARSCASAARRCSLTVYSGRLRARRGGGDGAFASSAAMIRAPRRGSTRDSRMRVLVVGSGGREHALCLGDRRLAAARPALLRAGQSRHRAKTRPACRSPRPTSPASSLSAGARRSISSWSGPRRRWSLGLVDRLEAAGIAAFGPTAAAAQLEGSKGFTKDLCARHDIPTAAYRRFTDAAAAKAYVARAGRADRGQGRRARRRQGRHRRRRRIAEAEAAIDDALGGAEFGAAGAELVIEEFLAGEEASFFALVDGAHALPLASAQDHKRVGDGDTGPNTGGMGAYSPAPCLTPALEARGDGAHHPARPWRRWRPRDGPSRACSMPG